ncbi:hypothetical protein [Actinotalea sp. K2]|uniref:hypothetical protein n=1 Tax=Actinotalea sp. K2 TaxID=2939438 RepID=UPI0020175557|nr:hypothetical protein [Actinotalea sp. K2]MCL3861582.1 hypothetical protein [Actinotalea sp. K2]
MRAPAALDSGQTRASRHLWARRARVAWAALWTILVVPLFVAVTVLTVRLWVVDPDYTETTPVGDLGFFALGAMIGAGFASQLRRQPPAAGVGQSLLAATALALCGLLGGRVEPLLGGVVLTAAAVALLLLHPQRRGLIHTRNPSRTGAGLALLAAAGGVGYAATMLAAALESGPSCFLGQCAHGDRIAELAATGLAVPALATLAAWRIDGWRLPLWSAGTSAVIVGASSVLLPRATGSLGIYGGVAAIAWGVLFVGQGELDRMHRHADTPEGTSS